MSRMGAARFVSFTDKVETSSPQNDKEALIESLATKYHLTSKQAEAIVADVYGEVDQSSDTVS